MLAKSLKWWWEAWSIHNTTITWNGNPTVHVPMCYITPHPGIISFYHFEFIDEKAELPWVIVISSRLNSGWVTALGPGQHISRHTLVLSLVPQPSTLVVTPAPPLTLLLEGHWMEDLGSSCSPSLMLAVQLRSCHFEPSFFYLLNRNFPDHIWSQVRRGSECDDHRGRNMADRIMKDLPTY